MKFILLPIKHYKFLQSQGKQNKQYWNKIAIGFLKHKHNANTMRKGFPIEMYMEGPLYKSYFITLTL